METVLSNLEFLRIFDSNQCVDIRKFEFENGFEVRFGFSLRFVSNVKDSRALVFVNEHSVFLPVTCNRHRVRSQTQ